MEVRTGSPSGVDFFKVFLETDLMNFIRTTKALGNSQARGNWIQAFTWLRDAAIGTISLADSHEKILARPQTIFDDMAQLITAILELCALDIAGDDQWDEADDKISFARTLTHLMFDEFISYPAGYDGRYVDLNPVDLERSVFQTLKLTSAIELKNYSKEETHHLAQVMYLIRRMFQCLKDQPEAQNAELRELLSKRLFAMMESCIHSWTFSKSLRENKVEEVEGNFEDFRTYIERTAPNMAMGAMILMLSMLVKPEYAGVNCYDAVCPDGETRRGLAFLAPFMDVAGRYCNDISSAAREIPHLQANGFLYLAVKEEGQAVIDRIKKVQAMPESNEHEVQEKKAAEEKLLDGILTVERIHFVLKAFFREIDCIGTEKFHEDLDIAHYQKMLREFLDRELSVTGPAFLKKRVLECLSAIERERAKDSAPPFSGVIQQTHVRVIAEVEKQEVL